MKSGHYLLFVSSALIMIKLHQASGKIINKCESEVAAYQVIMMGLNCTLFSMLLYTIDESKFRLPSIGDCACPGYTLTFECTVMGGSGTIWRGTTFSCAESNDEIILLHSRFGLIGAFGTCNNGTVMAQGIRAENDSYTSQLSIIVSSDVIGKSIECVYDDYVNTTVTVTVAGSYTIPPITGMLLTGLLCISIIISISTLYSST